MCWLRHFDVLFSVELSTLTRVCVCLRASSSAAHIPFWMRNKGLCKCSSDLSTSSGMALTGNDSEPKMLVCLSNSMLSAFFSTLKCRDFPALKFYFIWFHSSFGYTTIFICKQIVALNCLWPAFRNANISPHLVANAPIQSNPEVFHVFSLNSLIRCLRLHDYCKLWSVIILAVFSVSYLLAELNNFPFG